MKYERNRRNVKMGENKEAGEEKIEKTNFFSKNDFSKILIRCSNLES